MNSLFWDQRRGGWWGAGFRGIGKKAKHVGAAIVFDADLDVQRTTFAMAGQCPSDALEAFQNFGATLLPIGFILDGGDFAAEPVIDEQVGSGKSCVRGKVFCGSDSGKHREPDSQAEEFHNAG